MKRRLMPALAAFVAIPILSCSFQDGEDPEPGFPEKISKLVGMYTFQSVSFIDTAGQAKLVELRTVPTPETLWIDSVGNLEQRNTGGTFTHGMRTGCKALITDVETGGDGNSGWLHLVNAVTSAQATVNRFEIEDSLLLLRRAWEDSICMPLYFSDGTSDTVVETWKRSGLR